MTIHELQKAIEDVRGRLAALRDLKAQDNTVAVAIGTDGIFIELGVLRAVLESETTRLVVRLENFERAADAAADAITETLRESVW